MRYKDRQTILRNGIYSIARVAKILPAATARMNYEYGAFPTTVPRLRVRAGRMMGLVMRRTHRRRPWSIGIDVTKTAIAGDHVRHTGFEGSILAIPIDLTCPDLDDGAPRRIAEGMTDGNVDASRRHKSGGCERQFGDGFHVNILGCRRRKSNDTGAKAITELRDGSRRPTHR